MNLSAVERDGRRRAESLKSGHRSARPILAVVGRPLGANDDVTHHEHLQLDVSVKQIVAAATREQQLHLLRRVPMASEPMPP